MDWLIWIHGFLGTWFPAITMSTLLSVVLFFFSPYYKAKVEKNVQHNLDRKIEEFKSSIRKDEENFKSTIKFKDEIISSIRNGALSGMAGRYALLDKRRLEASENIWKSVIELSFFKPLSKIIIPINMDALIKSSARNDKEGEKARAFAETLWEMSGMKNMKPLSHSESERPFLPPIVWAVFSAYRQVLHYPMIQLAVARGGADILKDPKPLIDLVKAVLPHHSDLLDKHGVAFIPHLVDELEEKILHHIIESFNDVKYSESNIIEATKIIKASEKAAASIHEKINIEVPPDFSASRQV